MTEAAIDTGLTRDLYVSLGEPVGDGAWGVRVYYKPFVDWIWGGCFVMALGGLLALADRRYRLRRQVAQSIARRSRRARMSAPHEERSSSSIPLVVFVALAVFLAVGLTRDPREVPSPLIGKPAPAFRSSSLHEPQRDVRARGHEGQGLDAQRVGLVVRLLPRRASAPGGVLARRTPCPSSGLDYKDKREDGLQWLRALRQPVRALGLRRRRPRRHRLRRLRRARDLRDRQAGRDPLQADRARSRPRRSRRRSCRC